MTLLGLGVALATVYAALAWCSRWFAYGSNEIDRPILLVLGLFGVSFAVYACAVYVGAGVRRTPALKWIVFLPAVLFRALLLPTPLIQEVDIYRYLWDGAVTARGANPYMHPPAKVWAAKSGDSQSEALGDLVHLRDSSKSLSAALGRIHYGELATIYPPVSQAVFAASDWITPRHASIGARVTIAKGLLVLFDMGTALLLWSLLARTGKNPGWTVAYAWCPLVIKEFANSGHLDSIAVFFTTAAVFCTVEFLLAKKPSFSTGLLAGGALLLSLAIGAKLYPVVLVPVMFAAVAGKSSLWRAMAFAFGSALLAAVILAPLLFTNPSPEPALPQAADAPVLLPPPSGLDSTKSGLTAFLTSWEMNDFFFLILQENLRPAADPPSTSGAWFAVLPNAWREAITQRAVSLCGCDRSLAPFLVTRTVTSVVFVLLAMVLSYRVYRRPQAPVFLENAFLTLAWFWLLSPTQNAWYWTWALPLVPFAVGRAWMAVSGLVLLYYLRFWLSYHCPTAPVLGTPYDGRQFFDFVVTWIEYAPWLLWLAAAAAWRRKVSF